MKAVSNGAKPRKSINSRKRINLALQGGGAHGAFTWGVLDRILQDGRLEIDAISGTSAGAMNAVTLANGYAEGGADGAREKLESFWHCMSDAAKYSPIKRGPIDMIMGNWSLDLSWGYHAMNAMSRLFSPQQINLPLGASSKMNAEWAFLTHLRDLGRDTATQWLETHFCNVGERSTVDLRAMFMDIGPQHQG